MIKNFFTLLLVFVTAIASAPSVFGQTATQIADSFVAGSLQSAGARFKPSEVFLSRINRIAAVLRSQPQRSFTVQESNWILDSLKDYVWPGDLESFNKPSDEKEKEVALVCAILQERLAQTPREFAALLEKRRSALAQSVNFRREFAKYLSKIISDSQMVTVTASYPNTAQATSAGLSALSIAGAMGYVVNDSSPKSDVHDLLDANLLQLALQREIRAGMVFLASFDQASFGSLFSRFYGDDPSYENARIRSFSEVLAEVQTEVSALIAVTERQSVTFAPELIAPVFIAVHDAKFPQQLRRRSGRVDGTGMVYELSMKTNRGAWNE